MYLSLCSRRITAPRRLLVPALSLLGMALMIALWSNPPATYAQGPAGNLLTNPSFERPYISLPDKENCRIAQGWTAYWVQGTSQETSQGYRFAPEYKAAFWQDYPYNRVHSGELAQQYFHSWGNFEGGLWQQVKVPVGVQLKFSIWAMVWSCDKEKKGNCVGATSGDPSPTHLRIGIDPTGGTDAFSPNIVWSQERDPYDNWQEIAVEAVSKTPTATVFVYAHPEFRSQDNNIYLDDASLVGVGAPPTPPAPPKPTAAPKPVAAAAAPKPAVKLPPYSGQIYIMGANDTLQAVATRFGTTLADLMALNGITNTQLVRSGLFLKIPASAR